MVTEIWKWANENAAAIGIVIAVTPLIWATIQYIYIKRADSKKNLFETYHKLIKKLVQPEIIVTTLPNGTFDRRELILADRQLAIVFELCNFVHYFPASIRMLRGLRETWLHSPTPVPRVIEEIDLSVRYMEKYLSRKAFILKALFAWIFFFLGGLSYHLLTS